MLADIWRFTVAVVRHWQGYATGGVVTALLAVCGGVAFQAPRFLWPIQYRRIPRAMAKLASAMSR